MRSGLHFNKIMWLKANFCHFPKYQILKFVEKNDLFSKYFSKQELIFNFHFSLISGHLVS